jgi:hypothetical protein
VKSFWQILGGAWWPDDDATANLPAIPNGEVPVLQSDFTVIWTQPGALGGRWEPVTNGDPENPELVFADGDVVMYFVDDEA